MTKFNSLGQTIPERDFVFDYSSYNDFTSILDIKNKGSGEKYKAFTYTGINERSTLEKATPEGKLSSWFRFFLSGLCYGLLVTTFPISAYFCLKKVSSLQRLVLMRLGRLQPVKGPGLVVVLPFVDKYFLVDLSPKTLHVGPCDVCTADRGLVTMDISVQYQISNVVGYVTRTREHLEDCLAQMVKTSLVNKVSGLDQDSLDKDLLQSHVKVDVNSTVQPWGGEVLTVVIPNIRIIKAAEPKDPLSPLINSLGAMFAPPPTIQPHRQHHGPSDSPPLTASISPSSFTGGAKNVNESLARDLTSWIESKVRDSTEWAQLSTSFKVILSPAEPPVFGGFLVQLQQGCIQVSELDPPLNNAASADVELTVDPDHLRQIMSGQLGAREAYLSGKLKVEGDWTRLPL